MSKHHGKLPNLACPETAGTAVAELDPVSLTGFFFPWQPSQQSPQHACKVAESFSGLGGHAIVVWSCSGWFSHGGADGVKNICIAVSLSSPVEPTLPPGREKV